MYVVKQLLTVENPPRSRRRPVLHEVLDFPQHTADSRTNDRVGRKTFGRPCGQKMLEQLGTS